MELPRPRTRNIAVYFNQFARQEMPAGANQHYPARGGIWKVKHGRLGQGAAFDLSGPCHGALDEVVTIGLRLAQDAIEAGDAALAERLIARVESVKIEYEIAEQEAELARLEVLVAKTAEAQVIVSKQNK